jgi:hypothetical protein
VEGSAVCLGSALKLRGATQKTSLLKRIVLEADMATAFTGPATAFISTNYFVDRLLAPRYPQKHYTKNKFSRY